jgi:hypothetical protein
VKARTFARNWRFGENGSQTLTARFDLTAPALATTDHGQLTTDHLTCELFEAVRTIYDEKGFFTGKKNMMVDLDEREPRLSCLTRGLEVPLIPPLAPERRQSKAFYRYTGYIRVHESGLHRFKLHAPGPVVMKIANQPIVNVTGQYYLSSRDRIGGIVLEAGVHAFELTFCDPVFYRGRYRSVFKDFGHHGTVPISIVYEPETEVAFETMAPGAERYSAVSTADLLTDRKDLMPFDPGKPASLKAVSLSDPQPGLTLFKYDLSQAIADLPDQYINYPRDFLEVAGRAPFSEEIVDSLVDNSASNTKELYEYRGYLYVPADGVYAFQTDPAGINQFLIGDVEIQNSRLKGDFPLGKVHLEAGYHPMSLRIWNSDAVLRVKAPGMPTYAQVPMSQFVGQ